MAVNKQSKIVGIIIVLLFAIMNVVSAKIMIDLPTLPESTLVPGPITTAGTNTVCSGSSFTIPVTVANFNNVGIISLKLNYDPAKVEYQSATFNPLLNVLSRVYGASSGQFSFSAFGSTGVTLVDNSVLFAVTFLAKPGVSGTVLLAWSSAPGNCEYAPPAPGDPYVTVPFGNYFIDGSCAIMASPVPIITGPQTICGPSSGNVYITQAGMSNYGWTVSAGGLITGGGTSTSNTVTVTWSAIGPQWVKVSYTSTGGCSTPSPTQYDVTVHSLPVPTLTGPNTACQEGSSQQYTTESGMTNYTWSVSSVGTVMAGGGLNDNTVTVGWSASGAQTVSVGYSSSAGCSSSTPAVYNVTVNPLPSPAGPINGPSVVCAGASGVNYSIDPVANATTYVWTIPSGATVTSGANTNMITVNFSPIASSGIMTVYGSNLCGNGLPSTNFPIIITILPSAAGLISGKDSVCMGETNVSYSVTSIPNATGYVWTVPAGALIVNGTNTNTISVDYSESASSGSITVYGTNTCGSGGLSPVFNIIPFPIPLTPEITLIGSTLWSNVEAGNQWCRDDIELPGQTGQTCVPTLDGSYWDKVIANNCQSDTSNHISWPDVGTDDIDLCRLLIYPVPNHGLFKISLESSTKTPYCIDIYNNLGLIVFHQTDIRISGTMEVSVDLKSIPTGVYTVALTTDNARMIRKILVAF